MLRACWSAHSVASCSQSCPEVKKTDSLVIQIWLSQAEKTVGLIFLKQNYCCWKTTDPQWNVEAERREDVVRQKQTDVGRETYIWMHTDTTDHHGMLKPDVRRYPRDSWRNTPSKTHPEAGACVDVCLCKNKVHRGWVVFRLPHFQKIKSKYGSLYISHSGWWTKTLMSSCHDQPSTLASLPGGCAALTTPRYFYFCYCELFDKKRRSLSGERKHK